MLAEDVYEINCDDIVFKPQVSYLLREFINKAFSVFGYNCVDETARLHVEFNFQSGKSIRKSHFIK